MTAREIAACRTERHLVTGHVIDEVKNDQSPVCGQRGSDIHYARGLFGRAFFIPIFFIVVGFLIVPSAVAQTIFNNFWLVAGLVASLALGKRIAAGISGRAFGYARPARLTMWALTLPQVAATLAATLVGYNTLNAAGARLLTGEYSTRCWCCWSLPRFLVRS